MNRDHWGGMGRHMLIMLLCCLVPVGLVLAVSTFGLSLGPLQALLPYALVLLCPLMMIFMMRGMMGGQGDGHSHHHVDAPRSQPTKQISEGQQCVVKTAVASGRGQFH